MTSQFITSHLAVAAFVVSVTAQTAFAQQDDTTTPTTTPPAQSAVSGYNQPSQAILDVMLTAPLPTPVISTRVDHALLVAYQEYPSIARVATPFLRLAGVRVEATDKFGRVRVQLGAFAETVEAKVGKIFDARRISSGVHLQVVLQHVEQGLCAGIAAGIFKEFVTDLFLEAQHFEEMAVAVARERGNAHTSKDFPQSRRDRDCTVYRSAFDARSAIAFITAFRMPGS